MLCVSTVGLSGFVLGFCPLVTPFKSFGISLRLYIINRLTGRVSLKLDLLKRLIQDKDG